MRADHRTRAYSHGYTWTHETDENGFRNPPGVSGSDLLLLGDSIVYGHGVEIDETLAHYLRTDHDLDAYDMSAQGWSLYEHYLSLRLHLEKIRPETVLLMVFVNDIHDLEQLGRAQGGPGFPEITSFDYELVRNRIERLNRFREPLATRIAFSLAIVRLTAKTRGWRPVRPPESSTPKEWQPPPHRRHQPRRGLGHKPGAVLERARFSPIKRYYDVVLADLATRCNQVGTRLAVVHLVLPAEKEWKQRALAQTQLQRALESICTRHDLELVDTRAFFDQRTEWILPGDGHLNPAGHRALARSLSQVLSQARTQTRTRARTRTR
jgi:hypothetical protein